MTTTNTYLQGQKAFLGGDFVNSIKAFSDAVKQDNHSFQSRLNRGIAYFKIGRFAQAIKDFDFIINENDIHDLAYFYRGVSKLNLEENEAAIHDLNRSLSLNPKKGEAYLARGLAHAGLGHKDAAEKDIHNNHALNSVELGEFIEEYILSDPLCNHTLTLFENDTDTWKLFLTKDEVQRMSVIH